MTSNDAVRLQIQFMAWRLYWTSERPWQVVSVLHRNTVGFGVFMIYKWDDDTEFPKS